jgi:hypothetical protein
MSVNAAGTRAHATFPEPCDVLQAPKSRSATARRSAISCRLVWCSLSHPNLSQSFKLLLIADQKDFRAGDNSRDEMPAFRKFTTELLRRVDGRVHFASKLALCFGDRGNDVRKREIVTGNHDVHIARRCLSSGCHRAEDEGDADATRNWGQGVLENLRNAEGLSN